MTNFILFILVEIDCTRWEILSFALNYCLKESNLRKRKDIMFALRDRQFHIRGEIWESRRWSPLIRVLEIADCNCVTVSYCPTSNTLFLYYSAPTAPPENVTAYNLSSTSIMVTWLPVPEGFLNGELQSYRVFYRETTSGSYPSTEIVVGHTFLSVIISSLKKFTVYSVWVKAVTTKEGPSSVVVQVSTDEDGKLIILQSSPWNQRSFEALLFSLVAIFESSKPARYIAQFVLRECYRIY